MIDRVREVMMIIVIEFSASASLIYICRDCIFSFTIDKRRYEVSLRVQHITNKNFSYKNKKVYNAFIKGNKTKRK